MGSKPWSRRTASVLLICLATLSLTPALAHHVVGRPRFVSDSRYPLPIMTMLEPVGPWLIEMIQSPGDPGPVEAVEMHIEVSHSATERSLARPVEVTVRRLEAFAAGTTVFGPRSIMPDEGAYELRLEYPTTGNYLVSFAFEESEIRSELVFPVVVGKPGAPWVILIGFLMTLGLFLIVIRAVRIKSERCARVAA